MSVYKNDNPSYLRKAIESISCNQTVQPSEVVIVIDGPIPIALESVIRQLETKIQYIRTIWLSENKGLGNALRIGLLECKYEIVMRMDSDDLSLSTRFEKHLKYMESHPDIDICSAQISEFIEEENNIIGKRIIPCSHKDIVHLLKFRCPINHVCVCARRDSILKSGNYQNWHFNEDYYLWVRMYIEGCKFANLPDTLVNVRVGKEMYARRGGWSYFKSEANLQYFMLKHHVINLPQFLFNVIGRFVIQIMMPNQLRAYVFKRLLRKS